MVAIQFFENQRNEWNNFVAQQPFFGLLQSWEWGEIKEKSGWRAYRIAVVDQERIVAGAQMLVKELPLGLGGVAYIPRGPVCDWLDRETAACLIDELHRIAREHKVIYLKIEPPALNTEENSQAIRHFSFRQNSKAIQPRNTIIIDIDQDLEKILSQMRKKHRQYIHRAEREGITVRVGERCDLPAIIDLIKRTGRREHFPTRKVSYYELEWDTLINDDQFIYLEAWQNQELIAVRSVYRNGIHAAEFHAGSVDDLKNLHPNYLLVWEAIKWAKSKGCKTYDLWGIPDDIEGDIEKDEMTYVRRDDGLWGVYRFKSGFSKNVVCYVGAYDYVYRPLQYAIVANPLISRNDFENIAVWVDAHSMRESLSLVNG